MAIPRSAFTICNFTMLMPFPPLKICLFMISNYLVLIPFRNLSDDGACAKAKDTRPSVFNSVAFT